MKEGANAIFFRCCEVKKKNAKIMKSKCQHKWEYFDCWESPNGSEHEHVRVPHRKCKKCGRVYFLFGGIGEYKNRWRRVL